MNKDAVTLQRIEQLHPLIKGDVKKAYDEICEALNGRALCRFPYTIRTVPEQDGLFAIGRTVLGANPTPKKPMGNTVTNAKGGQSYHNYGLAVDIVLLVDKDKNGSFESASWETNVDFDGDGKADWQEVVQIFKRYGFTWGGDWTKFPDMPHFERTFGYSVNQLLALKSSGKVDKDGFVLINAPTV